MKPLIALFTALALAVSTSSLGYPEKLVRLVVPLPPGGHADIIARQIALQLSAQWKQPAIVENRPGSNTIAAADFAAKAPADGHTILMATEDRASQGRAVQVSGARSE